MAIPNGIQTAALIAGTVLTAAGLNLGVIGLGEPEPSGGPATGNAEPIAASEAPANDGLVLTAAPLEAPPLETPSLETTPLEEPPAPGLPVATPAPAAGGGSAAPGAVTPAPSAGPAPSTGVASPAPPAQPAPTPSGTQPAPAVQPPAPQQPAPTQPAPTAPQPQSSPSTTPATAAPTQPAPQPPASQTKYLTYQFAGIADITVALHDGTRLEFWSAVKAPGWVSRVDDNGPGNVKVKFMRLSDGEEAEFEVMLTGDGDIDVKMEA